MGNIDFAAVGALAGVGLVLVGIAAILFQGHQARVASRIDNSWQLYEYWDSDRMWMLRARAAREIRKQKRSSDMTDVLNFFDHLGYLVRRKWIDTETVWVMFSDWALPYWRAAAYAVRLDQRDDPFLWEDFEHLNERLVSFEAKRRRARGQSYAGPSDDDVRELLSGEIGLCPGQLHWRRWL